jgi:16S rRNA A1518/A1519 N6-dimethyltransferase RsmA/KsgA/DIM1 with predicted DNA glycosylase/AP lyase activity
MTLTEMRSLLVKRDIQLTRSLGQNFLHDGNQLRRIVDAAEIQPKDKILEIGPGLGPLTELLLEKAGEVLAIEMDARLVEFLCERFGLESKEGMPALAPSLSPEERENVLDTPVNPAPSDSSQRGNENPPLPGERVGVRADNPVADKNSPDNLFLIHDDALAFLKRGQLVVGQASSLSSPAEKPETGKMPAPHDWSDWKLVANLPYSVASPILVELAAGPRAPKLIVATLQLEVAKRLLAKADDDDYGVLTLLVQIDFEPRSSFKIPPECFFPSPDVDSACVCLVRRATPLLPESLRPAFVKIVKRGFSQRRKMMLKLLKQDWPADKLVAAFAELKISPQERAEKLSLEQFVALTKILFNHG